MNRLFNLLIFGFLIIAAGCNPYPDFQKHEGGLFSKFHVKNGGTKPVITNIAVIDLLYRTKDSVFYDSRSTGASINLTLNKPDYRGDLNTALQMMSPGDSATFIMKADSFFIKTLKYNRLPKGLKKDEVIFLEVKMHRFYTQSARDAEVQKWKSGLKSKENELIKNYITTKKINPDTTRSGLMIVWKSRGNGSTPKPGDKMKVDMKLSLLSGKQLFSSKEQGKPLLFEFGKRIENKGVEEALSLMAEGAAAEIIVPSSLAFGEEGRGEFIPPYTPISYVIEMIDIVSKEEEQKNQLLKAEQAKTSEVKLRDQYLKEHQISAKPTTSGLYYVETKKGNGIKPKIGDKVKVHYRGFLVDGKQFDSSIDRGQPFEFVVGQGKVIKGWDEGIKLMSKGAKAKLIIPSAIGYGERGSGAMIGPYSTLIFDIELIDISNGTNE
jgi:FKBP-type peptidyl-prolyl cis-trans isomerase